MYLDFFRLREPPFQITPDVDFLFMSKGHARAKAYMDYALKSGDGFVVITGEVGAGKTTLMRKLLSEFDNQVRVAKIFQTQLDEVEFLQAVLMEFGLAPAGANKVELMDMLAEFLTETFAASKQLVLIVDEAQNLSPRVLEEIRMLSGLETQKQKILQVILIGQPQLDATLDAPGMEQLRQRVRLRFRIAPLSEAETRAYIAHRLRIAGCERNLFADETIPLIYAYTGGIPRLINTLCDTAMLCAFADDLARIEAASVSAAIAELQWTPYRERKGGKAGANGQFNGHARPANGVHPNTALAAQGDAVTRMLDRLDNIEMLLAHIAQLLKPRNRRISVRLGRAGLGRLAEELREEAERRVARR